MRLMPERHRHGCQALLDAIREPMTGDTPALRGNLAARQPTGYCGDRRAGEKWP